MATLLEVFADITCPFTHVGLKKVVAEVHTLAKPVDIVVRAWPLEWVNGEVFAADVMRVKVDAIGNHLGQQHFSGFDEATWPATTIAALNLAASAYAVSNQAGLEVSLRLRSALFEDGLDIADPSVLAEIAHDAGVPAPPAEPTPAIAADFEEGKRRGVRGSPEFWVDGQAFFCPSLQIGHDEQGLLTAQFDPSGLDDLLKVLR